MKKEKMEINVERISHNGYLILSTIYEDQYFRETYIDYTGKEARALFREHVLAQIKRQNQFKHHD